MIYNKLLHIYQHNPALSNSVFGFGIFGAGDIFSQIILARKHVLVEPTNHFIGDKTHGNSYDLRRIGMVGLFGSLMNGYVLYKWYALLDLSVGSSLTCKNVIIRKVLADQFIFAPAAIITYFLFNSIRAHGISFNDDDDGISDFKNKMKDSFWSTYLIDCSLWPGVNFINFRYVPLYLRPSFVGIAQIGWQTYVAYVANK
jgi:hypothetical protein